MRKRFDWAWFNLVRLFRWHRLVGIGGLSLLTFFLVSRFSQVDVSWALPRSQPPAFSWPDIPLFRFSQTKTASGGPVETIYTVPTRQLTPQELSRLPKPRPAQQDSPTEPSPSAAR